VFHDSTTRVSVRLSAACAYESTVSFFTDTCVESISLLTDGSVQVCLPANPERCGTALFDFHVRRMKRPRPLASGVNDPVPIARNNPRSFRLHQERYRLRTRATEALARNLRF